LGHEPSPVHTRRLKSQHHDTSSSTSTTPALSLSCTHTLHELHPPLPPYLPYHVLGPWRPCLEGSFGSITPSPRLRFAASLSVCTVGNTLLPMLQTVRNTVRSRRKSFNRFRSISPFSSPTLEAASSDTHRVTDSFHGNWVYPSSLSSWLVALLSYSYNPLTRLAHYCLRRPSACEGRASPLHLVVVLHSLGGGCQRLGFLSNGCNVTTVIVAPAQPLFFFHCPLLRVLQLPYQILNFVRCLRQGVSF